MEFIDLLNDSSEDTFILLEIKKKNSKFDNQKRNLNQENLLILNDNPINNKPKNKIKIEESLDSLVIINNPVKIVYKVETSEQNKESLEDLVFNIEEIPKIDISENENHIFVKDCDASEYYGNPDNKGCFLKDNLFSELTTDYERLVARLNLGIADKYSLLWGNISGNLLNQVDLINLIQSKSTDEINRLINELNTKLNTWTSEINWLIKNKADINSPHFTGNPTTDTPNILDNSNRIPTTEWVNILINANLGIINLLDFTINPIFAYVDNIPKEIEVNWEYEEDVEKLWLNDKELDPKIRKILIEGINSTKGINLKFQYNGRLYFKTIIFEVVKPIYFGISDNYLLCERTKELSFNVNAINNQYIYIFMPDKYRISVNGLIGGFNFYNRIKIGNIDYTIYKSDNYNLGDTLIDLIK